MREERILLHMFVVLSTTADPSSFNGQLSTQDATSSRLAKAIGSTRLATVFPTSGVGTPPTVEARESPRRHYRHPLRLWLCAKQLDFL